MFNVIEARAAQMKHCEDKELPHFAPKSGNCWSCGKNIYQEIDKGNYSTGITVEEAGRQLITGCPHCSRSYCD